MNEDVEVVLTKLLDGRRVIRFVHSPTGLSVMKTLDPIKPLWEQKERLRRAFEAALAQELETVSAVAA